MPTSPLHVRRATAADLPALPAIEVAAGALFRDVGMDSIAEDDPPTVAELLAAPAVWVAAVDGEVVGYARAELVGDRAHLEQLSVHPDHGGQGIGTALIEAVVAWAAERGDDSVTLTTFRSVAFNAPLYARRGFVEVPEQEWTAALRGLVAAETAHGLDPSERVVMRRPTRGTAQ